MSTVIEEVIFSGGTGREEVAIHGVKCRIVPKAVSFHLRVDLIGIVLFKVHIGCVHKSGEYLTIKVLGSDLAPGESTIDQGLVRNVAPLMS